MACHDLIPTDSCNHRPQFAICPPQIQSNQLSRSCNILCCLFTILRPSDWARVNDQESLSFILLDPLCSASATPALFDHPAHYQEAPQTKAQCHLSALLSLCFLLQLYISSHAKGVFLLKINSGHKSCCCCHSCFSRVRP